MQKSDLKDGYIIEVEWSALKPERYIKLGEDLVGPGGNIKLYILEDDLIINQGLNAISKVTKVFENRCMTDLNDIENDECLTLLWERPREIDWSKVPRFTPVRVKDSDKKDWEEECLFIYKENAKHMPFNVVREEGKEIICFEHCEIIGEIKEEWYK